MALKAADPDQQVEHAGEPGAGGDIADAALIERDRAGVPTLDQGECAGFAGEADHLHDVGDQEVAETTLQVEFGFPARVFWSYRSTGLARVLRARRIRPLLSGKKDRWPIPHR